LNGGITELVGATSPDDCKCPKNTFRELGSPCTLGVIEQLNKKTTPSTYTAT